MNYESQDMDLPNEGDLYKVYEVAGFTFEIRYGYYEENERGRVEPLPLFPDFRKTPVYTADGYPLASLIHSACKHYESTKPKPENGCGDCIYYSNQRQEIAVCQCEKRRKPAVSQNKKSNPICGGNEI